MTNEEKEFEELALLEEFEAQDTVSEDPNENFTSNQVEAAALGAMESIPFAKDVAAGAEALYQEATEDDEFSLSQMTDKYRHNKREWDDQINEAESKYPATFIASDIATGVGLAVATGGTSLAANVGLGALEGVSRSEDRDVWDAVVGGALAGAADRVTFGAGKLLGFAGKHLGILSNRGIGEGIGAVNKSKARELNDHVRKMYLSGDKTKTLTEGYEKFANDMLEETTESGKPFFGKFQTLEETQVEAAKNLQRYGKEMGTVLSETDEVIKSVDVSSLHRRMIDDMVTPLISSEDPITKKLGGDLAKKLRNTFKTEDTVEPFEKLIEKNGILETITEKKTVEGVYKDLGLKDLHRIKLDVSRQARNAFEVDGRELSAGALELRKQVGITTSFIDDIIDEAGVEIPSAQTYKKLKRKWSNMLVVERMAADEAASKAQGPFGRMKGLMSLRGMFIGSAFAGVSGGTGLVVAGVLNEAMSSSRVPLAMAKGVGQLAKHLQNAPDSKYAKRILVAGALSADSLREAVTSSIAELNLSASPVKRSYEDAASKRSSIVTALERIDKDLARKLDEAFANEDSSTVGQIMDRISKNPNTKGLIDEGIGWDGLVHDEADRAQLEEELRTKNLPVAQEQVYLEELNKQRKIPEIQEVEPFNRKFVPRNKNNPPY